jgi:two-component system cell cycle response regulator
MKLLVADDSAVYRKMLQSLLESWQYEVVLAEDGNQALALLQGPNAPRLALLDGVMPGLSGPELCQAVRRQGEYIYTILLSANGREHDIAHGFELGADDYLAKPFMEFELKARLRVGMRIIKAQNNLVKTQQALQFQATHDPLTSVWNRGGIMDILNKEISRASREGDPLSVCLMDIDHFKRVNDTYGHLFGDEVLRNTTRRVTDVLRPYDSLGRYGGEEFLAVLPNCCGEAATGIAERMRRSVGEAPMACSPSALTVTVSLGVCEWSPTIDVNALLQQADAALYGAKATGRNRSVLAVRQRAKNDHSCRDRLSQNSSFEAIH